MPLDQDSNNVLTSYAVETSLGVLPGSPTWRNREPNSFPSFGGNPSLVSRAPIGSRKKLRGTITGIDVKGGWNEDFTPDNFPRLLQGVVLNAAAERFDTMPLNVAQTTISTAAAADQSFNTAGAFAYTPNNRDLILATGFTNLVNNGVFQCAAGSTAQKIVAKAASGIVNENPPNTARIRHIGVQFAAGDATMTYAAGVLTLATTAKRLDNMASITALAVGEWVFIGGDAAGQCFATISPGYARIASIAQHAITFDKTTFAPATDNGAGQTITLWFGRWFQDAQDSAGPTVFSYSLERQLGNDGNGIQAEYLDGTMINEANFHFPKKEKLSVDLATVSINYVINNGTTGPRTGTHVAAAGEGAFNTASDIYRSRMSLIVPGTLNPSALWGYCVQADVKLTNGLAVNEAQGKVGGFDINIGELDVEGTVEAYFATTSAASAVQSKSDVTWDIIFANYNVGWVLDFPLLELGDGLNKVEKNKPIMLPLKSTAVRNSNGYVVMFNQFMYLPNVAMAAIAAGLTNVNTQYGGNAFQSGGFSPYTVIT